ncbi:DUF1080 domain-containing protein [Verrucomicrobiota bacterium]
MIKKLIFVALISSVVAISAYAADDAGIQNTLTEQEQKEGWQLLFNGKDLSGWAGYKADAVPECWEVKAGELLRNGGDGGDIITANQFGDFELKLEWKIPPKGNSGIFVRVQKGAKKSWGTAIEMQVLDNVAGKKAKPQELHSAGACYGLYPTDLKAFKGADKWNKVHIKVEGKHYQYWFNDVKIADFVVGSDDWNARYNKSKFKKYQDFAKAESGYIGLQSHGGKVYYRNIKLKKL